VNSRFGYIGQRTEPSDEDPRREEARLVRVSGVVRGLDGRSPRAARPALPAEIVAATVLCGELLLGSALAAEDPVQAHAVFGRDAVTNGFGGPRVEPARRRGAVLGCAAAPSLAHRGPQASVAQIRLALWESAQPYRQFGSRHGPPDEVALCLVAAPFDE
jgi:hypothetical protein